MKNIATIAVLAGTVALAACDGTTRTASGFLCPNGRPEVATLGSTGPSQFGSCDPVLQDAVDRKVAEGRTYRYLTASEAYAATFNAMPVGAPPAGTLPATGTPGFGGAN